MRFARIFFRPANVVIAVIVAILAVVGAVALQNIRNTPPQFVGPSPSLPAVQQQQPSVTDLQRVEQVLGPFVPLNAFASNTPDTNFPAVVLIKQDGSEAASESYTVPFTPKGWARQDLPQISNLTVSESFAAFTTSSNTANSYTVRTDQPFVLEAVPQYVVLIDAHGKQWIIGTTRAMAARHHL